MGIFSNLIGSIVGGIANKTADRRTEASNKKAFKRNKKEWTRQHGILKEDEKGIYKRGRVDQMKDKLNEFVQGREAAIAGGFNPLTTMGMSQVASANYGGSINAAQMGTAEGTVSHAPLASIGLLTDGLSEIGEVLSGETAQDQAERDLRYDLNKIELEQRVQDLEAPKFSGYSRGSSVGAGGASDPLIEPGRSTETAVGTIGNGRYYDRRSVDAEMWEARYGDIAQEVGGVSNVLKDSVVNSKLQRVVTSYGREVADEIFNLYAGSLDEDLDELIERLAPHKDAGWSPTDIFKRKAPSGRIINMNPSPLVGSPALTRRYGSGI